ncbi:(2Fe-2S)-binding protein [Gallaecimonas sp. GXIMD4217]|uniref:(2Fe-2S)-binding protein n=1 Tax=Gallaecimonas sp. GXIMD4217 TaxID=3131927 RepID=UPI00311B1DFA
MAIEIVLNGRRLRVEEGQSLAAVLLERNLPCGRNGRGQPRAPLCGMGVCFGCRVTVDGHKEQLACQFLVRAGMEVSTRD